MSERVEFSYGEFYDVPKQIRLPLDGPWLFLRSSFDDALDDYPDHYDVYLVDGTTPYPELDFANLPHVGRIEIDAIGLDATKRKTIDAEAIRAWLALT